MNEYKLKDKPTRSISRKSSLSRTLFKDSSEGFGRIEMRSKLARTFSTPEESLGMVMTASSFSNLAPKSDSQASPPGIESADR